MKAEDTLCVIYGREGFESGILWRCAADYLCGALKEAGFCEIERAETQAQARMTEGRCVLALRSDVVPDMKDIIRLTENFDGEATLLRLPDGSEAGFIAEGRREPAEFDLSETIGCERGFLAAASEYERFVLTQRLNRENIIRLMESGVRFKSADGILICPGAVIGEGSEILPGTIIKGGVVIGKNCVIGANTVMEDSEAGDGCVINASQIYSSRIGKNVRIGPFAHIRPNCRIGDGVKIGDFVELKNSVIGEGTSVAHLTYVGDSDVGRRVNFGCGCVTVNYDGRVKSRTVIGDDVFVGCNSNLVAPVKLGDGSYIAAGSTVTDAVPEDALAIARARQVVKDGWAKRRRENGQTKETK